MVPIVLMPIKHMPARVHVEQKRLSLGERRALESGALVPQTSAKVTQPLTLVDLSWSNQPERAADCSLS